MESEEIKNQQSAKELAKEGTQKAKGFIAEFKTFISRGSVMDLAVGIIIGGAFTAIVNSLVNDITMPAIAALTGGQDFTWLNFIIAGEGENAISLNLGNFIAAIINFLLIALVVFIFVKLINKLRSKDVPEEAPTTKKCPFCLSEIAIDATRCPHCTSKLEGYKKD